MQTDDQERAISHKVEPLEQAARPDRPNIMPFADLRGANLRGAYHNQTTQWSLHFSPPEST